MRRIGAAEILEKWREAIDLLAPPSDPRADNLRQTWTGQMFWLHREQGRLPN